MVSRTVVARLAGEEVGRFRKHLPDAREAGGRTPPQPADFIAEGRVLLQLKGLSRGDMERVEFEVSGE